MSVETGATLPHELNKDYPFASDFIREGDDHLRLIKLTLLNSFKDVDKPIKEFFVNLIYPVGIITTFSDATDPNSVIGGTWEKFGAGKFLLSESDTHAVGSTGGSEKKSLVADNIPAHAHHVDITSQGAGAHSHRVRAGHSFGSGGVVQETVNASGRTVNTNGVADHVHRVVGNTQNSTGTGSEFDIMPPYETVVYWKRTA